MTDTKPRPGIYQLDNACWTVLTADGEGAGYEGSCSHYDTEAQATKAMPDYQDDEQSRDLQVVQENAPCWVAVSLCGALFIDYGDVEAEHFDSKTSLLNCIEDDHTREGWSRNPDGSVLCGSAACVTCHPATDPLNVPVPNVEGQQVLPLEKAATNA